MFLVTYDVQMWCTVAFGIFETLPTLNLEISGGYGPIVPFLLFFRTRSLRKMAPHRWSALFEYLNSENLPKIAMLWARRWSRDRKNSGRITWISVSSLAGWRKRTTSLPLKTTGSFPVIKFHQEALAKFIVLLWFWNYSRVTSDGRFPINSSPFTSTWFLIWYQRRWTNPGTN